MILSQTPQWVNECRNQFPAFERQLNGRPVIYFDGPAGTQVPRCVADAISDYLFHRNANHGGLFATSIESDKFLHHAHQVHSDFVGAKDPYEIAFGQNMTSLTFAFSRALSKTWKQGDEIVVTALDHDANITPWVMAAEEVGATVKFVNFKNFDYLLDIDHLDDLLSEKTRLIAVGCASNATGGINPVKLIAVKAKQVGAQVYLDAVHFGPHGLIDVEDWGCDYLACSNYKFFGPHLGMLWGRRELMEELSAFKVRPAEDTIPGKWMTGTQSHESIAGGTACIEYLADLGRQISGDNNLNLRDGLRAAFTGINDYEKSLSARIIECFASIAGIEVFGVTDLDRLDQRFPTFSIRHASIPPATLAKALGEEGIFVWNGNYYALEFSQRMGFEPDGMVRIGAVHYNTMEEIERLQQSLGKIVSTLA
ncbi:MAG: cysteine desulfurase-like protein [Planctomycetota bacterium]